MKLIGYLIFALLLFAHPAFGATALATAANALPPGNFSQLSGVTGLSTAINAGSSFHTLEFTGKAVQDATTGDVYYLGASHNQGSLPEVEQDCSGNSCDVLVSHWKYVQSTNAVSVITRSAADNPPEPGQTYTPFFTFHGYDHQTICRGKYFHRPYDSFVVRVFDIATQAWETSLPSLSSSMGGVKQQVGSLECFPEMGTFGSLLFFDGDWGVHRYTFSSSTGTAGSWSEIINTIGGPDPRILFGAHSNVSAYSPKKDLVVFGGGINGAGGSAQNRNAYKIDTAATITQLTDFPCNVSDNDSGAQGHLIPDPITGNFLVFCFSDTVYMLDPTGTGTYIDLNVNLPFTWTNGNNFTFAPIHDLNVIMLFVWVNSTTSQVWLFKPNTDFVSRCNAAGVVKCVGFDTSADITGDWSVDPTGLVPSTNGTTVTIETALQASGAGAARFNIPTGSTGNANLFYNFADDYSVQFGANSEFFVSMRQYMGPGFALMSNAGFKQMNVGTGSKAAGAPNSYGSCTDLEIVLQSLPNKGFMQAYNKCPPSNNWENSFSGTVNMQTGRSSPFCLHSQTPAGGGASDGSDQYPPNGNCWKYREGEWIAYKLHCQIGPRSGNFWTGSHCKIYAAYDGEQWDLVHDWTFGSSDPDQHFAGTASEDQKYGQVWLLARNDCCSPPWPNDVFTMYDELIISTQDIAAPGFTGSVVQLKPMVARRRTQ